MSIPYALERTAHWSGSRVKFVTCEKCGTEYVYRMERWASGSGTSFLFLDNAGAKERAELEAKHKVNTQLEQEDDIEPKRGMIYKHILRVYSLEQNELQLCITASRNEFAGTGKDGPDAHFLRVFSGYEQENLGASPDWGDITKFESRALELVQEHWAASIHSSA